MRLLIAISAAAFVLFGSTAMARPDCSAAINDGGHVITDPGKVERAISAAGNHGATIKVMTFDTVPARSLKIALLEAAKSCSGWQNTRGSALANNLIIVGYGVHAPDNPEKQTIGMVFGADEAPYLGTGKENNLLGRLFVPSVKAYDQGRGDKTALTDGFVKLLDGVGGVLAQPVLGGNVVSIHKDATSYTGLWLVLLLLAFGAVGYAAYKLYHSFREENDDLSGAQAEARRVRSELVTGLNGLNADETYLSAKVSNDPALRELFDRYKALSNSGLSAFSVFDNLGGDDPNRARLSERQYAANQGRYSDIIRDFVNPAKELARQIRAGKADPAPTPRSVEPSQPSTAWGRTTRADFERSQPSEPTPPSRRAEPSAPSQPSPYTSQPSPGYPSQSASGSDGFLESVTGGFVGNVLADSFLHGRRDSDNGYSRGRADEARHQDYQRQQDSIDDARSDADDRSEPSNDDGASFNVDSSPSVTDSGSSYDVDSSSSSSSYDSGSSSSSDSSSSSYDSGSSSSSYDSGSSSSDSGSSFDV